MLQPKSKFSLNYLFFLILCSGGIPILTLSKNLTKPPHPAYRIINQTDTVKPEKAIDTSLPINSSDTTKRLLTVDTVLIKVSKDSLNAPLEHSAEDSMVMEVDTRKIFLYGKTEVKYEDVVLNAPKIEFDQQSQYVTAKMGKDTAGVVMGMAKLKQAETVTVSDSLNFNLKSQKGLTYSSFFQQEDFFNYAQKVKKISPEIFYASNGRFTTCNLDTPHFAFSFKKAKFINKKLVVTGPVHPEFEDVPVPIYLPFGIFPMK
jgi:lipopolysaccharide assembly outer membrane protein LptD (OstA)